MWSNLPRSDFSKAVRLLHLVDNMPKEVIRIFCRATMPNLGAGSSREVFALGGKLVAKLAINDAGMEQNREEELLSDKRFTTEVFQASSNGRIIVSERGLMRPSRKSLTKAFGFDVRIYQTLTAEQRAKYPILNWAHNAKVSNDLYKRDSWTMVLRGEKLVPRLCDYGHTLRLDPQSYRWSVETDVLPIRVI